MAYSTGTASTAAGLLQALATFAGANGWTVDNNAAYSGGWWVAVHKGSNYFNYFSNSAGTSITIYGATGFNSGAAPSAQANTSGAQTFNLGAGPYTGYHFFAPSGSSTYLYAAIEISSGVWGHLFSCGLNAVGGASPCSYAAVTQWNYTGFYASYADTAGVGNFSPFSHAQTCGECGVTVDSTFRWFNPGFTSPRKAVYPRHAGGWQFANENATPNIFNGLPILLGCPIFVERAVGGIYSYIGDAPDIRLVKLTNNAPKDEITIGSDTWKLFPVVAKNATINVGNAAVSSGMYGYAIKKNG